MAIAKTQKALGVLEGIPRLLHTTKLDMYAESVTHRLIRNQDDILQLFHCGKYKGLPGGFPPELPMFARPCPIKPRHGFVESRTVNDVEEIKALMKEVHKEDANGEILLGNHYDEVKYNAVYVSSGALSIGPGNDGATGGKESVSFPIAPYKSTTLKRKSKIKESEEMYVEAILPNDHSRWALTQIRGGPAIDAGNEDFVPRRMIVKKVVTPCADLLLWEKQVKKFDNGTVVYGNGHTLASHAAVHCILHDIPFVVSHEPHVGDTLKSTECNKRKHTMNREQFKKGVFMAIRKPFENRIMFSNSFNEEFRFCFAVLHNWFRLKESPHADWLIGVAITTFARLCAALVLGEYRHHDSSMFGSYDGRDAVYRLVKMQSKRFVSALPKVFEHFYSGSWNSGFGGIPWANCSWYTIALWQTIIAEYNSKVKTMSHKNIAKLMDAMNRTINQAHNNGWWFNKIATQTDMDFAAKNPALTALCVADLFYAAAKSVEAIKDTKSLQLKQIRCKKVAPCGKNAKQKLVWAYMWMSRYDLAEYKESMYKNKKVQLFPEIYEEGAHAYSAKPVTVTRRQVISSFKNKMNDSGKVFLKIVPHKGFRAPGGTIVHYKGIQPT